METIQMLGSLGEFVGAIDRILAESEENEQ